MRQFENGYVAESGMLGYTYEDYQEPSPPASFLIWRPQQLRPLIPFSPLFETPCSTAYGLGPLPPRNITLLPPPSFVGTVTDADGVLRAPNPRVLGEDHAQLLWLLQEANHCGSDEGERTHEDNVSDVLQLHREFGQAFHERTWEVDMRDVGMSEGQAQGQASWDDLVDYGEMDGAME
ncbi:hypothetical protein P280DRAFT_464836 [Massarina eburnea CBS 473.64]|uniref:Uncharacterized protein n=1 Tax=Massarina eburnea CBS 473.64 TaxID=1395130 RepID=A0A6A6SKA4_9PLEO|nr:hypothetical protein P280DRAFT_464836 [Massarina eburnea CBS 473.64]